jgi:hypothetical protein
MKKTLLISSVNLVAKLVIVAYGTLAIGGLTYFFYRMITDNLF